MLDVKVNKDISQYPKSIRGITLRTFLCTSAVILITVGAILLLYDYLTSTALALVIMCMVALVVPFYLNSLDMFQLPFEKVIRLFVTYLMSPKQSKTLSIDQTKEEKESRMLRRLTKNKYKVPRSIQQYIPYSAFYDDGIFQGTDGKYTAVFSFSDVDFRNLSDDDKQIILDKYEDVINSMSDNSSYSISVINRTETANEVFEKTKLPLFPPNPRLSDDINSILLNDIGKDMQKETGLFLTVSSFQKTYEDAQNYFEGLYITLASKFNELGIVLYRLTTGERIRLYYNLYHLDANEPCVFTSLADLSGQDPRNFCCPSSWIMTKDHIEISDNYYRTLVLHATGTGFSDQFWRDLTDKIPDMTISTIKFKAMQNKDAKVLVNRNIAYAENKLSYYRTNKAKHFDLSDYIPPAYEEESKANREIYEDLSNRNQKLYIVSVFITLTASTIEELDLHTKTIKAAANDGECVFETLYLQQTAGLFSSMPFGSDSIEVNRFLTTESVAAFIPLHTLNYRSYGKMARWEGTNPITKHINSLDRTKLNNGNGIVVGDSGSGKSVQIKLDISQTRIKSYEDADIIILDPKGEYSGEFAKAHEAVVIDISVNSRDHINVMEMSEGYGSYGEVNRDPLKAKISMLQSFIYLMVGEFVPQPVLLSVVDKAAKKVYKSYVASGYTEEPPTLEDLYYAIMEEDGKDRDYAHQIASSMWTYAIGSLNVFSQLSNIPKDTGMIVYNMRGLDDSFREYGLIVMLDQVRNRIAQNAKTGRYTYIWIDEIHKMLKTIAEPLLMEQWKMGRSQHCCSTGVTQNILELNSTENGQLILNNSEYLKILRCKKQEIDEEISRIINVPASMLKYIQGTSNNPTEKPTSSQGLIEFGSTLIPFRSEIPHNSYFYSIINTD